MMNQISERKCKNKMKMDRLISCLTALCLFVLCLASACAEMAREETEQGVDEIQQLLEMAEVSETEGMGLEETTDAFTKAVMNEYIDSVSGFSMQYPAAFVFDEEADTLFAATADGKATLVIDHLVNEGALDEKAVREAIRIQDPEADILQNEQNGCLRVDSPAEDGISVQTDLYLLTENYLHHIVLRYPDEEKGIYSTYIQYMINTMTTRETDLG